MEMYINPKDLIFSVVNQYLNSINKFWFDLRLMVKYRD